MASPKAPRRPLLRRRSIRIAIVLLIAVFAALWFAEPAQTPSRGSGEMMKAIVYHEYGPPEVLRLEETERMLPDDHQILVKVRAASVNPLDWHYMRGTPYIMRVADAGLRKPKSPQLGVDVAGVIEAVGKNVTEFKVGDEVFGTAPGAFAEYARANEKKVVLKPADLTFEQAASIPIAALTALQALRDKGRLQPRQKVLINGASGGVGTFAVQIAKAMGADVTGVCSTRNVELVRSLGADQVIDYTQADFAQSPEKYDLVLDNVGNRSLSDFRRVLKPKGIFVGVGGGGPDAGNWIGPLGRPIKAMLISPFVSQELISLMAEIRKDDLMVLRDLIEAKKVTPVIDRTYPLSETADAIRYVETGRARGKVVITVGQPDGL